MNWRASDAVLEECKSSDFGDKESLNRYDCSKEPDETVRGISTDTFYIDVRLIYSPEEITTEDVELLAQTGGSFAFLNDVEEIKYKEADGKEV